MRRRSAVPRLLLARGRMAAAVEGVGDRFLQALEVFGIAELPGVRQLHLAVKRRTLRAGPAAPSTSGGRIWRAGGLDCAVPSE